MQKEQVTKTGLIVEDDAIQQKVLRYHLEQLSYQVETAENASIAIELIRNKPYTVILLDLGLPDQSGEVVIRMIRTSGLNQLTPIVICTAHASAEKEEQCLELGANKVLIKPIKLEVLGQTIKAF